MNISNRLKLKILALDIFEEIQLVNSQIDINGKINNGAKKTIASHDQLKKLKSIYILLSPFNMHKL